MRNQGVLRIIQANEGIAQIANKKQQYIAAFEHWLDDWLGENELNRGIVMTKPDEENEGEQYEPIGLVRLKKKNGFLCSAD